eukprot:gene44123-53938_t
MSGGEAFVVDFGSARKSQLSPRRFGSTGTPPGKRTGVPSSSTARPRMAMEEPIPTRRPLASNSAKLTYKRGEKVMAKKLGEDRWISATIETVYPNGKYDVVFDDLHREYKLNPLLIKKLEGGADHKQDSKPNAEEAKVSNKSDEKRTNETRLKEGDKVEVNYGGKGKYFPGRISKARLD